MHAGSGPLSTSSTSASAPTRAPTSRHHSRAGAVSFLRKKLKKHIKSCFLHLTHTQALILQEKDGPCQFQKSFRKNWAGKHGESIINYPTYLVGTSVALSTSVLKVRKQERNFLLSPMRMTLEMQGSSLLMASSMGTGATFSPPAVISSSLMRPGKAWRGRRRGNIVSRALFVFYIQRCAAQVIVDWEIK